MEFPYGKAAFWILLMAVVSGAALVVTNKTAPPRPDLVYMTFARDHKLAYEKVLPQFEKEHNCHIQLQLVDQRAVNQRLQSALQVGAEVPDMVELLDGTMGTFTKGPLEDVGFIDLTDWVSSQQVDFVDEPGKPGKKMPLHDALVVSRFTKWSSRGHIFALPHDVHPVMLAYRKDIVDSELAALGMTIKDLDTWDKFAEVGRKLTKDKDGDGNPDQYMIDFPVAEAWGPTTLIYQNDGALFDADGQVVLDSDNVVDAICFYVKQCEGKTKISRPCGWGQNLSKAMIDGLVLFYICPDWRTKQFSVDAAAVKGKMAVMPLPAFKPGARRTSTWGATGLAITKECKKPDLAKELAMFLYYKKDLLGDRFAETNIIPPLRDSWNLPELNTANPFYSGQKIGAEYAALAPQVPSVYVNAYTQNAEWKLNEAFTNIKDYYAAKGEIGLREFAKGELKRCADTVRRTVNRNAFLRQKTETK